MKVSKVSTVDVTAGGTYNVSIFSSNEMVYVKGSATLAANLIISPVVPPMGLSDGTRVSILYNGTGITFGGFTSTVFGLAIPDAIKNQKLQIDAYYNGVAWDVFIGSDYDALVAAISNFDVIFTDANDAADSTANAVGSQLLRSHDFDNPIEATGDKVLITVTGTINSATDVDLKFTLNNGSFITILTNMSGAAPAPAITTNGDFIYTCEIVCSDFASGNYKRYVRLEQDGVLPYIDTTTNVAVNLCGSTVTKFILDVYATENTPVGGEVTIYGVTVESRKKL